MPTPFEPNATQEILSPTSGWAAQPAAPPRSIYSNFQPADRPAPESNRAAGPELDEISFDLRLERSMARSYFYRFLAKAFEDPEGQGWRWLTESETVETLSRAALILPAADDLVSLITSLKSEFKVENLDTFASDYITAFGHAARGRCPMNEIEYGDTNADPLFQPHRLADLAAFYRGFGMQMAEDASERQDHLCIELEFMSVLAAKEAYAVEQNLDHAVLTMCIEAQKKFLREHLGRWAAAFAGRLAGEVDSGPLAVLARLLRVFVQAECRLFGVSAGSGVLPLRPVDQAAESLCGSCGLQNLPPGATNSGAENVTI